MAYIRKRKGKTGISYRAEIRMKGQPSLSATFKRKTDANPSLSPYISNSMNNNGLKIFMLRYGTTFVFFWCDNGLHCLTGIPCEFQCAQQNLL